MNPPSWSIVGVRNTGAVSRMKSFQNWPGTSGTSGAGPSRISRSSKPFASSVPANDSSTMNTTRCPRSRRTLPIPTQLLVGPKAPSGKNTIVRAAVMAARMPSAAARRRRFQTRAEDASIRARIQAAMSAATCGPSGSLSVS